MMLTCVSCKVQSVFDYCIVNYGNPHLLQDIKVVRGSDMITNAGLHMTGLNVRYIFDHALVMKLMTINSFEAHEVLQINIHK